eukprot:TRINITY_DN31241_c0_g1_i1.p1 TRINITY_DN31241_c0_g1~~TRINITY_DN31241_c0_g1_i1.p1  ORF type:complete len:134 (-),score=26.05 TRINITY_DN31241_c0_g1_i1:65-466(-)
MKALTFSFLVLLAHTAAQDTCQDCSLQTYWGSEDTLSVATRGIFAIWWDPVFDHGGDAEPLFEILDYIRDDCLYSLGMADPPNPSKGYFYIVYIHHGDQDLFPNGWLWARELILTAFLSYCTSWLSLEPQHLS